MVDTIRTLSALQTLLADNTSGDISPQDLRDMLVSVWPNGIVDRVTDVTDRSLTTDNTWEDIATTSLTWTPAIIRPHYYIASIGWTANDGNWAHHQVRVLLDGATTNVTPTTLYLMQADASRNGQSMNATVIFEVDVSDASSQTVKLQSHDSNSSHNRLIHTTDAILWGPA